MKNKLKILLTSILTIAITFSLTSCGEKQKAEKTIKTMLNAFKSYNYEDAQIYMDTNTDASSNTEEILNSGKSEGYYEEYLQLISDSLEYQIISSETTDNNNVIVKTEITTDYMGPVMMKVLLARIEYSLMASFSDSQLTKEEQQQYFNELYSETLENTEHEPRTYELDINVTKNENEEWKIQADNNFLNALLGGLLDAAKEAETSNE